jgi:hypothetical protein
MRPTNERCRALLLLLQKLHEAGYGGLRFMPTLIGDYWSMAVGPRLLFSCRDGSFVPHHLRHRLVWLFGSGAASSLDGRPRDVLEKAFFSQHYNGPFGIFLQQSKFQDDAYYMWLKSLRMRVESDPGIFPKAVFANHVVK